MAAPPQKPGPRQRSSTAARHQNLHGRLLAAALHAIETEGLASLRARSLAETVGCSVGAIYGVYPDLDALVLTVNGQTLDQIEAALRAAGHGGDPSDRLVGLAMAYLDYAATHRNRWRALFIHRMPAGQAVPAWYLQRQAAAFARIEAPLGQLQPGLAPPQRALLARSVFSAVHGMVDLGLDEKIAAMPLPSLRVQVELVVNAIAAGLGGDEPPGDASH